MGRQREGGGRVCAESSVQPTLTDKPKAQLQTEFPAYTRANQHVCLIMAADSLIFRLAVSSATGGHVEVNSVALVIMRAPDHHAVRRAIRDRICLVS